MGDFFILQEISIIRCRVWKGRQSFWRFYFACFTMYVLKSSDSKNGNVVKMELIRKIDKHAPYFKV